MMIPIIILVAPSGSGKSSILRQLRQNNLCAFSVSVTTRAPRQREVEGQDYYFFDKKTFLQYKQEGLFLETTSVCHQFYGTLISEIERLQSQELPIVLELDILGAQRAKQFFSNAMTVMVIPPSLECLTHRLKLRGTECQGDLERRLSAVSDEVKWGIKHSDYFVINEQIDQAVLDFSAILRAESLRKEYSIEKYQKTLEDFL